MRPRKSQERNPDESHADSAMTEEDSLNLTRGDKRKYDYQQDTEHDKCIRKCTTINILLVILFFAIFKLFVLIGNGYYTFRRVDRSDCFAQQDSHKPIPHRQEESDENITATFMIYIQIAFWITVMQVCLLIPSIKNPVVSSILCFLLVPDFILFIVLNVIIFKKSTSVCLGEYLSDEEVDSM